MGSALGRRPGEAGETRLGLPRQSDCRALPVARMLLGGQGVISCGVAEERRGRRSRRVERMEISFVNGGSSSKDDVCHFSACLVPALVGDNPQQTPFLPWRSVWVTHYDLALWVTGQSPTMSRAQIFSRYTEVNTPARYTVGYVCESVCIPLVICVQGAHVYVSVSLQCSVNV